MLELAGGNNYAELSAETLAAFSISQTFTGTHRTENYKTLKLKNHAPARSNQKPISRWCPRPADEAEYN